MSVSGSVNGCHAIATSDTDCKHVVSYFKQSESKEKYIKTATKIIVIFTATTIFTMILQENDFTKYQTYKRDFGTSSFLLQYESNRTYITLCKAQHLSKLK